MSINKNTQLYSLLILLWDKLTIQNNNQLQYLICDKKKSKNALITEAHLTKEIKIN